MVTEHITVVLAGRTVIAVVNYYNGDLFDWAAYQGRDRMPAYDIPDHGDKIAEDTAHELFPQLDITKWRA